MKNTDQVEAGKEHPSSQAVESPHSAQPAFPCGHPLYMRTKDDVHYCAMYPDGLSHEDEDDEDEECCRVLVDLDQHCGKPITRVIHEPYTPAAFAIECCEECAESMISQGYIRGQK